MAKVGEVGKVEDPLCWRKGWTVKLSKGHEDFPLKEGDMFLIGRRVAEASKGKGGQAPQASTRVARSEAVEMAEAAKPVAGQYSIAWLGPSGEMQVESCSFNGSQMTARVPGKKQEYWLSANVAISGGTPHLKGDIRLGQDKDKYTATGTWGAEGNGGGQGTPKPGEDGGSPG